MTSDIPSLLRQAGACQRRGDFRKAEACYRRILAVEPDHFDASHRLGLLCFRQGRNDEAHAFIRLALRQNPASPDAWSNLGLVLGRLGRAADALASFDKALALKPDFAEALNNRGAALRQLGRLDDALASYGRALAIRPDYAEAHHNRGTALRELDRPQEALASYEAALAIRPRYAEALANHGAALLALDRPRDALASFDKALAISPHDANAHYNRGTLLLVLMRVDEALASFERALVLKPAFPQALINRGNALKALQRPAEALASYEQALAIAPGSIEALENRASTLKRLKRFADAIEAYRRVLALSPQHPRAPAALAESAWQGCDWAAALPATREVARQIAARTAVVEPFGWLGCCDDPASHLECASAFAAQAMPRTAPPLWRGEAWRHDRIRVAYVSGNFTLSASGLLVAGLFEAHDRSRFEVFGVSFGPDDHSALRARLIAGVDRFHDMQSSPDADIAARLRDLEIDIAVDLRGYDREYRTGIFCRRPAPIQVGYLGYPGTMGVPFMDYVLADPVVLPLSQQPWYTERIVHLPDCYQATDSTRPIAAQAPSRAEAGLPEAGFVFCCFNNSYKITPEVFDVWMRLLREVENSVLWLIADNTDAMANLRREAARRGVEPVRLVFAARTAPEPHLARHRLADLFLDTLPYNAHATASDALWAGLPIVTCRGNAFAGRVAASLLTAAGLGELVTTSLDDYHALALALARDPARLAAVRATLARNRLACPLFDTARLCRHIESAYATMWQAWQRGEPPRSFAVDAIG